MDLHEFQSKRLLESYGIPIPAFAIISSIQELQLFLSENQWPSVVLKAQIHSGGRGKAGGIKFASDHGSVIRAGQDLLGKSLITSQTGPRGLPVSQLLITPSVNVVREYYLSVTIDRTLARPVLIASPAGGVEIERIAHEQPDQLLKLMLPPEGSFRAYHLIHLAKFMGWTGERIPQGIAIVHALVKAFKENDASLLEINPLVQTQEGRLVALDVKLVVDDNALYRQPRLRALFDCSQLHPQEALAQQYDLSYVALDGNIGCMVNGAGLAMATMDFLKHYGGKPANFLDIGGGASQEKIAEGFKIILSDPKVRVVLLNIFGGIMDGQRVAAGILAASRELGVRVPLVVRLEGTNAELGKQLLRGSDLNIVSIDELAEAVQEAVKIAAIHDEEFS